MSDRDKVADWPNCAVADCPYKANLRGRVNPPSSYCVPHQMGRRLIPNMEWRCFGSELYVNHKNGDPKDNSIDNLEIKESR